MTLSLIEFCRSFPKTELHLHLTGAVAPQTLRELAKRNGATLSEPIEETLFARGTGADVTPILPTLKQVAQVMCTRDDFALVAYDAQCLAAECGVRYRELFWNPTDHMQIADVAYETALAGLIDGLEAAEKDLGIRGRLIPSIDREGTPEQAGEMLDWVLALPSEYVIGLGMDYLEVGNPPEKFWKTYRRAGAAGLKRTAHAGEFLEPARNVETCLDLLECDRIDHGYTIVDAPDLLNRCRDEGIVFTVVPTNSTYLKVLAAQDFAEVHPLRKMADSGLRIMPNSDDPPLHHTDPARCWADLVTRYGLGIEDLRKALEASIDAAWVDDGTKAEWRRDWLAEFDRLRAELPADAATNGATE